MADPPRPDDDARFTLVSASLKLDREHRGLMFYAVSLLNPLHRNANLDAAMTAIKHFVHPETHMPNLVIHITDGIYAFNFMIENPALDYAAAKVKARALGNEWAGNHMTRITDEIGFQPVVFNWSQWQDKRPEEYAEVLEELRDLQAREDCEFRRAFESDVERFVERAIGRRRAEGHDTGETERARVRSFSMLFVLHEATGYILIGRHIVADYLEVVRTTYPDLSTVLEDLGGLPDGAFRLYPGGQLACIEWLQRNRDKLPRTLWGAEGVRPIRIDLETVTTSNHNAFRPFAEIFRKDKFQRAGASHGPSGSKPPLAPGRVNSV